MARTNETLHNDVILSSAGVTASIVLADPTIFLSGFSKSEQAERPPALVRGSLIVRITKATKIKAISLNFKGLSRTYWPEGIPSDKSETHETKEIFSHEWRLFSAQFPNAERSSGAHTVFSLDTEQKPLTPDADGLQPVTTSSTPHELVNQHDAVSKGYRIFNPAEYVYNFELMLPHRLPETLKCNFGHVRWGFTLGIERYGTFKPNLSAHKEVTLIRTLGPSNLEASEPIVISKNWEDLLHYEIIIAGKAFTIGQRFNVAFSLVPLAKVKCHRIRIYITEHTEYFCRNHRIHRVEPSHKFLLLEKKSPDGNRGDLLKMTSQGTNGFTEFEFNVEIPETFPSRRDYLRPNASTEYIKVYHWIKAVMRLSRQDITRNGEPKCYEVSIDSPITLIDPRAAVANELPDYDTAKRKASIVDALKPYQEFIQKETTAEAMRGVRDKAAAAAAATASGGHPVRAIHYARQPSIAPPPFDADVKPPDILPPEYDVSKEDVKLYERRYEEYLISTGRLPPASTRAISPDSADNASDSNASTLSRSSDSASGSTAHTTNTEDNEEDEQVSESLPKDAGPLNGPHAAAPIASSSSSAGPSTAPPSSSSSQPPPLDAPGGGANSVPVFSEIIWTENADNTSGDEDLVDPRSANVATSAEVMTSSSSSLQGRPAGEQADSTETVGAATVKVEEEDQEHSHNRDRDQEDENEDENAEHEEFHEANPQVDGSIEGELPELQLPDSDDDHSLELATCQSSDGETLEMPPSHEELSNQDAISPSSTRHSPKTSPASKSMLSVSPGGSKLVSPNGIGMESSSPRPIPKRSSGSKPSPFSPPPSHNQKMRGAVGAPSSSGAAASSGTSPGIPIVGGRPSPHSQRLTLKTPVPVSRSAGSPLSSPRPPSDSNAAQFFGERWMDRRGSAGSFANSPRYFRQSSVVSVDIARQGVADVGSARDSVWSNRRPSRVGEVQELRDWYPLSRRSSETSSIAVSIAEYQGLHTDSRHQANAPLLGDEESEMDIGLEWEHDFEDYDLENDRNSVVSAFYTVLTP